MASKMSDDGYTNLKQESLQNAINQQMGSGKANVIDNGDGSFSVEINDTAGRSYTIEDNGKIIEGTYDKWDGTSATEPTQKNDTEIHITKASELKWLANQVNDSGIMYEGYTIYLDNNLDLGAREIEGSWENTANESVEWTAIGKVNILKATFEGNNHTIKGVYINTDTNFNGIFGNSNTIQNLTIRNSYIKGARYTGGIVGALRTGKVENCHNINTTCILREGENYGIGGVVGHLSGEMINCSNTGKVIGFGSDSSGYTYAGGVVGFASRSSTVSNCNNAETVSSTGDYIGGVVGIAHTETTISNCNNTGTVSSTGGSDYTGGVVGIAASIVTRCYNIGTVSSTGGGHYTGGVVGASYTAATISNCNNTGTVSSTGKYTGGVAGGANMETTISNCNNTGTVSSTGNITGGVVGVAYTATTISNCNNTGTVSGTGETTGGVVGAGTIVTRCYNTGNVSGRGSDGVGGVVGTCVTGDAQNVSLCYNSGTITSEDGAGGIIGYLGGQGYAGIETKCYNKGKIITTGTSTQVGGVIGRMANDANVTNSFYLSSIGLTKGVGAINSPGDLTLQNQGAQATDVDLKTFEEFLNWIEQQ